jgi:hypothetical protein
MPIIWKKYEAIKEIKSTQNIVISSFFKEENNRKIAIFQYISFIYL